MPFIRHFSWCIMVGFNILFVITVDMSYKYFLHLHTLAVVIPINFTAYFCPSLLPEYIIYVYAISIKMWLVPYCTSSVKLIVSIVRDQLIISIRSSSLNKLHSNTKRSSVMRDYDLPRVTRSFPRGGSSERQRNREQQFFRLERKHRCCVYNFDNNTIFKAHMHNSFDEKKTN